MIKFNINKYDYQTKPASTVRSFNIYSLNDNGFHKYTQKDSDALQYLLYPHLEDILGHKESQDRIIQEQIGVIDSIEEYHQEHQIGNSNTKEEIRQKKKSSATTNDKSATAHGFHKRKSFSQTKPKNMNVKLEVQEKDHLRVSVVGLKKDLRSTQNHLISPVLRYNGFTPQNLPRLDDKCITNPTSPSCFNRTVRESLFNNKIKRTINNKNILEENKKLSQILNKSENLPKVLLKINASDFKAMRIQRTKNHGSFMGEKYNPFNNDYHFLKSAARRNVYGSLFQH